MMALEAIQLASYLCEEADFGRLRVVSKKWPLDVILRHIEQVDAEYFVWCALPNSYGIVCFLGKFDASGPAASELMDVLSEDKCACPVALRTSPK